MSNAGNENTATYTGHVLWSKSRTNIIYCILMAIKTN